MVFVPFDATEEEAAALSVVRDGIPSSMEAPLRAWITRQVGGRFSILFEGLAANLTVVHELQAALHLDLGAPALGDMRLDHVLGAIYAKGERTIMQVTDFLLSRLDPAADGVQSISKTLDWTNSKYCVIISGGAARLALRLAEGITETAQSIITEAGQSGHFAGQSVALRLWHGTSACGGYGFRSQGS